MSSELVFVGLGLNDENGISLRGLNELRTADTIFIEFYTNFMPDFSIKNLEKLTGKKILSLKRRQIEDDDSKILFKAAKKGKTIFLVPGDPLIATTHVILRIQARKLGIKTRIVHGVSVISAIIALSGLHSYKFGKSVTIPFVEENPSITPYNVISQNKKLNLHTICLLDINTEKRIAISVNEAFNYLLKLEEKKRHKIVTTETIAVVVARAGSHDPIIKADFVKELLKIDFYYPPYSIIFPGSLHFTEAEALVFLADGPKEVKDMIK